MDGIRGDVDGIKVTEGIPFPAHPDFAFAANAYHDMLMPVLLEAAESSRSDLEIPEMEARRFPLVPDEDIARDIKPAAPLGLV